ncbi:uncharacterized protein LOC118199528 [Stegodyphus dumicola]|uniref:uncharacterized protein LOC118199528 n=1 Tax=Stegodyphus dumicola TaxID=202533 RepID=UPI0015AE7235|nr:uncharacterized protein LOC118199528 [Stegodyphus dumicola]
MRSEESSLCAFTDRKTLVSYVPQKLKTVILISSMHHSKSEDLETENPEIIKFYNVTKGSADALDEKCSKHSTSRRARRWPMAIFFRLLDVSGINEHVVKSHHQHQSLKDSAKLEKTYFWLSYHQN